jgi:hypothetical protein
MSGLWKTFKFTGRGIVGEGNCPDAKFKAGQIHYTNSAGLNIVIVVLRIKCVAAALIWLP